MKKSIVVQIVFLALYLGGCQQGSKESLTIINDSSKRLLDSTKKNDKTLLSTESISLDDECNKAGSANCIISPFEAGKMVSHFEDIYTKNNKLLGEPVWIDAEVIINISNYLDSDLELSGLRFCFGAYSSSKKSTIFLVPTVNKTSPKDVWRTNIQTSNSEFKNFNLTENNSKNFKQKFDELYIHSGEEGEEPLSKKVWFDKCIIKYLSSILQSNSTGLDGIRVYFAAYNKLNVAKGQIDPNQSTVVIVPTTKMGDEHIDNFDIMEKIYNINKVRSGALNHGQLCPNECND